VPKNNPKGQHDIKMRKQYFFQPGAPTMVVSEQKLAYQNNNYQNQMANNQRPHMYANNPISPRSAGFHGTDSNSADEWSGLMQWSSSQKNFLHSLSIISQAKRIWAVLDEYRQQYPYEIVASSVVLGLLLLFTPLLFTLSLGYPLYCTWNVLLQCRQQHQQQQFLPQQQEQLYSELEYWLKYWAVVVPALLLIVFCIDPVCASWLPLYTIMKVAFISGLAFPQTNLLSICFDKCYAHFECLSSGCTEEQEESSVQRNAQ
jgi:hypothetical protein